MRGTHPVRQLGTVLGARLASAIATVLVTALAARLLTHSAYGHLAFFLGTATFLASVLDLGISVRFITSYKANSEGWTSPPAAHYWSAQVLSYCGGALLGLLTALGTPIVDYLKTSTSVLTLAPLLAAGIGLGTFVTAGLSARGSWGGFARVLLLQAGLRSAGAAIGILAGGLPGAMVGTILGSWVALIMSIASYRNAAPRNADFLSFPEVGRGSQLILQSRWYALAAAVGPLGAFIPLAFVSRIGESGDLAAYGLASNLALGSSLLVGSAMTTLLPIGSDESTPLKAYLRSVVRTLYPVTILLLSAMALVPLTVPTIFGEFFRRSVVPLELMLMSAFILTLANPLQFIHYRSHRVRFLSLVEVTNLVAIAVTMPAVRDAFGAPVSAGIAILVGTIVSRTIGLLGLLVPGVRAQR
jgi:O-antigen/teichoic acid export membrane protein